MDFINWLEAVDREFRRRYFVDHVLAGFDEDEMRSDWALGEAPVDWVIRIGKKYDLYEFETFGQSDVGGHS